jgi:hypothetical protein
MAGIMFLSIVVALPFLPSSQAQEITTFLPTDKFDIPQLGGSISFAVNGSYRSANLVNNTWVFRGLALNHSQTRGILRISVQDSNITITDFRANSGSSLRSQYVRYIAEGRGIQTVNFNLNTTTRIEEWMVRLNGVDSINEKNKWYLRPNDTVVVVEQTGNITVIHYTFDLPDNSDQPFYMRHSVAITMAVVLTVTILAATIISIKTRR